MVLRSVLLCYSVLFFDDMHLVSGAMLVFVCVMCSAYFARLKFFATAGAFFQLWEKNMFPFEIDQLKRSVLKNESVCQVIGYRLGCDFHIRERDCLVMGDKAICNHSPC